MEKIRNGGYYLGITDSNFVLINNLGYIEMVDSKLPDLTQFQNLQVSSLQSDSLFSRIFSYKKNKAQATQLLENGYSKKVKKVKLVEAQVSATFQTSPFSKSVIVNLTTNNDKITANVFYGVFNKYFLASYTKLYSKKYSKNSNTYEIIDEIIEAASARLEKLQFCFCGNLLDTAISTYIAKKLVKCWIPPISFEILTSLGVAALSFKKRIRLTSFDAVHVDVNNIVSNLLISGNATVNSNSLVLNKLFGCEHEFVDIRNIKKIDSNELHISILAEQAKYWFELHPNISYEFMQYYVTPLDAIKFSVICNHLTHIKLQVVQKNNSVTRQVLENWFATTGCPFLLNNYAPK